MSGPAFLEGRPPLDVTRPASGRRQIEVMVTMDVDDVETYRRHAVELIRYATALVGPDDASDVVTDAVLAAFRSPRWRGVANQRAYLYRAVLTRSASHHRSAGRRRARELKAAPVSLAAEPPSSHTIDAYRALAQLSEQQRAVVYLTYWEDLPPRTIARLLKVSEGTVRKQLARAREQLRRILDA